MGRGHWRRLVRRRTLSGRPLFWSAGPRARLVGDDYSEAYFGVTPAQSRPVRPIRAAGLYVRGRAARLRPRRRRGCPLSRDGRTALVFVAGYDMLTGDAGDSPLVQLRGSQEQASTGLFLVRRFP